MSKVLSRVALAALAGGSAVTPAVAENIKIVSWNMAPGLYEAVLERAVDIQALDAALEPDIIVLIEVAGINEVRFLAKSLGWPEWYAAISDGMRLTTQTSTAIETAVISKLPIEQVIEYDAKPDQRWHPVMTNSFPDGDIAIAVSEVELTSRGIAGVDPMAATDRGTIRVDIEGGLSVFPIHLKSNVNGVCFDARDAAKLLGDLGLQPIPELAAIQISGNAATAREDRLNATKRERVIAAIKTVADEAAKTRTVLLAGDFNTSFEDGKFGSTFNDCDLQPYSCSPAPFPAGMCVGDGFDDTFAILSGPLVGDTEWLVLTSGLGRTYDDDNFADKAIDHLAVTAADATRFTGAGKADKTFGSDHFPIFVELAAP